MKKIVDQLRMWAIVYVFVIYAVVCCFTILFYGLTYASSIAAITMIGIGLFFIIVIEILSCLSKRREK